MPGLCCARNQSCTQTSEMGRGKAEHESCRAASVGLPFTSRGHACAVEGLATTLHGARTNAKPNGKLAHALGAPGGLEGGKDSFF